MYIPHPLLTTKGKSNRRARAVTVYLQTRWGWDLKIDVSQINVHVKGV